jgi:hypothetical protein
MGKTVAATKAKTPHVDITETLLNDPDFSPSKTLEVTETLFNGSDFSLRKTEDKYDRFWDHLILSEEDDEEVDIRFFDTLPPIEPIDAVQPATISATSTTQPPQTAVIDDIKANPIQPPKPAPVFAPSPEELFEQEARSLFSKKFKDYVHPFCSDIDVNVFAKLLLEKESIPKRKHYSENKEIYDTRIIAIDSVLDSPLVKDTQESLFQEYYAVIKSQSPNTQELSSKFEADIVSAKEQYKTKLTSLVNEKITHNKDLGEHTIWGTKFGRTLANIIMAIPLVIPEIVNRARGKGSLFLSWKTETQKNLKPVIESVKALPTRPKP